MWIWSNIEHETVRIYPIFTVKSCTIGDGTGCVQRGALKILVYYEESQAFMAPRCTHPVPSPIVQDLTVKIGYILTVSCSILDQIHILLDKSHLQLESEKVKTVV
jgi:hypothetical protein